MLPGDPAAVEVKLQLEEALKCRRELGLDHLPSEEELYEWHKKISRENKLKDEEDKLIERQKRKALEIEIRERELVLIKRKEYRTQRPSDYIPPVDVDQLSQRSKDSAAYSENCKLMGDPENLLLIDLDLEFFNLSNSEFHSVIFTKNANLNKANLKGSVFNNVIFKSGCKVEEANFDSTEIDKTTFEDGVMYKSTSFQFAKFHDVNIQFDRNYIANAIFYKARRDKWFSLSSYYSGIWQFINIALSSIYFCTILFKLYFFEILAKTQANFLKLIPDNYTVNSEFTSIMPFDFIFGDRISSIGLALMLLLYQTLRLFITTKISPLIESERQTGYTPDKSSYISFLPIHTIILVLGFLVMLTFIYDVYSIFQLELRLPKSR